MPVTTEEVAAAKAFLSELPLGIASSTGIAAVRTMLASHALLEAHLQSAAAATGTEPSPAAGNVVDALVARVDKLREALDARTAEAIVLKDRNALTETRLQQALDEARKRDEGAGLLEEERQRAVRAESSLRRAEERVREADAAMAGLNRRVQELEQLFRDADGDAQRQAKRGEEAEAAERAAREVSAEKDEAIAALRTRMVEAGDVAARHAEGLARTVAGLQAEVSAREAAIVALDDQIRVDRERIGDLVRSGEAQSSYAAAQQELVQSLQRELEARQLELARSVERNEAAAIELRAAKGRLDELHDALLPFAEMAESYNLADAGWVVDSGWCEDRKHRIVVADFRAARAAAFGQTPASGTPLAPDLIDDKPDPNDRADAITQPDAVREATNS